RRRNVDPARRPPAPAAPYPLRVRQFFFQLEIPFPHLVDRRINHQLQNEGRKDAADHRGGDALHHVGSGPDRPHNRYQAHEHGGDGHELRPDSFHRAMHDRRLQVAKALQLAFQLGLVVSQVQIEQHEHAGLGIDTQQRDQTDPHPDSHVVAEKVQEPDGAHSGERYGQDDDQGLGHGLRVEIQQHDDQKHGEREHDGQLFANTLHGLVLAAPGEGISGWKLHFIAHHLLGFLDIAADIAAGNVDVHVTVQHAVLVAQHGGTAHHLDLGQLGERHLGLAVHSGHQDAPQFVGIAAVIPHVTYVDGIALAALDSGADVLAADSTHDYVLSVVNAQTVARQLVAIPLKIEEVAAAGALRE